MFTKLYKLKLLAVARAKQLIVICQKSAATTKTSTPRTQKIVRSQLSVDRSKLAIYWQLEV